MKRMAVLALIGCSSGTTQSRPATPPPPAAEPARAPPPVVDPNSARDAAIARGKNVYETKGCIACHTLDGTPRVGISLAGIWGTKAELADGSTKLVDADFVRGSLATPAAYVRKGYPPSMPAFEGMLKADEIDGLVAFIESLATK